MSDEYAKLLSEAIREIEGELDLGKGFLISMILDPERLKPGARLEHSDWSFMIMAHALLESAVSELLTVHLGQRKLRGRLSRLPMGGPFGKLAFAKALDIIPDDERRFTQRLGDVRNDLVHSVNMVRWSIAQHMTDLSDKPGELRKFVLWANSVFPNASAGWKEKTPSQVKYDIWLCVLATLSQCVKRIKAAKGIPDGKEEEEDDWNDDFDEWEDE